MARSLKVLFKRKNIKNKLLTILIGVISIINLLSAGYLIKTLFSLSNISYGLVFIIILLLFLITLLILALAINVIIKEKKISNILFIIFVIISISLNIFIGHNINQVYDKLNNLTKTEVLYTTNLITLESSNLEDENDIKDLKIGIINDEENIEGYVLAQTVITKYNLENTNTIITYSDFPTMLIDLYANDIDLIFVPSNYIAMFNQIETYQNIDSDTKIILSYEEIKENVTAVTKTAKKIDEPFTLLITGVDSTSDGLNANAAYNGDALMLLTFNPNTLNTTMLSIPRDTYVPISCFGGRENKITHSAWNGESCVINTIEDFTDIEIDYYVKINFKGVVDLVDTLGGVTIDVPMNFCEQNSDREFGSETICLEEGTQLLDGEEALALARHRKTLASGDIARGLNQQLVVSGILNNLTKLNSLNKFYDLLDIITKNIETNMTVDQMLSFYDIGMSILKSTENSSSILTMESLFLKGYSKIIYDPPMKLPLYDYVPYEGSIEDITTAMKINLELIEPELIKEMSFSIKDPYETKVIGNDYYTATKNYSTLPKLYNMTKDEAIVWGASHGFEIVFETVSENVEEFEQDKILDQDIPAYSLLSSIDPKTITLSIVDKPVIAEEEEEEVEETIDCLLEENSSNSSCQIPNLIGLTPSEFNSWFNSISYELTKTETMISLEDETYDETNAGLITIQSVEAGTPFLDILDNTIGITYMEEAVVEEPASEEEPADEEPTEEDPVEEPTEE